jgi:hypothetical protein
MDKLFKPALLVGVFAVAFALFQHSQNGRYQYSTNGNQGIVLDTRTGEFWTETGTHFQPQIAQVTLHVPSVDDQEASDRRRNEFKKCLESTLPAIVGHSKSRDCLAEQKIDFQPVPEQPEPGAPK